MAIEFENSTLKIDGMEFTLKHSILGARSDGELVFVVYDYSEFLQRPARNLECFDKDGRLL